MAPSTIIRDLCLQCGLCCNGVIFRDVELQASDDPQRLEAAGLTVNPRRHAATIPQPCSALGPDLRCKVYADRPKRCREFECDLFKAVARGELDIPAAIKVVRSTRQRAVKVQKLLSRTGDEDETSPLARRFQRVQRRCEAGGLTDDAIDAFGELSLAVHALNVVLSTRFYPG